MKLANKNKQTPLGVHNHVSCGAGGAMFPRSLNYRTTPHDHLKHAVNAESPGVRLHLCHAGTFTPHTQLVRELSSDMRVQTSEPIHRTHHTGVLPRSAQCATCITQPPPLPVCALDRECRVIMCVFLASAVLTWHLVHDLHNVGLTAGEHQRDFAHEWRDSQCCVIQPSCEDALDVVIVNRTILCRIASMSLTTLDQGEGFYCDPIKTFEAPLIIEVA